MKVCAVVATYNRRDLLTECLGALEAQTRPPDHTIVVDNASTDGTTDLVRERFPNVELIELGSNTGGAGAFHAGMGRAEEAGYDWLWVMDDDTIATPQALQKLLASADRVSRPRDTLVLASRVLAEDGTLHPFNRPWPDLRDPEDTYSAVDSRLLPIRYASFVSLLVRRDAVEHHGLPIAEFFIWLDDVDFTARVLREARGYLVPDSVVHHKSPTRSASSSGPRYFYALRNMLWLLRGPAFGPSDRSTRFRLTVSVPLGVWHHLTSNRFSPAALRRVLKAVLEGLRGAPR